LVLAEDSIHQNVQAVPRRGNRYIRLRKTGCVMAHHGRRTLSKQSYPGKGYVALYLGHCKRCRVARDRTLRRRPIGTTISSSSSLVTSQRCCRSPRGTFKSDSMLNPYTVLGLDMRSCQDTNPCDLGGPSPGTRNECHNGERRCIRNVTRSSLRRTGPAKKVILQRTTREVMPLCHLVRGPDCRCADSRPELRKRHRAQRILTMSQR
jgi:hypothetical protein